MTRDNPNIMEVLNKIIPPDNAFFRILSDIPWKGLYFMAKYFFIAVDVFLIIAIIVIYQKAVKFRPKLGRKRARKKGLGIEGDSTVLIRKKWEAVLEKMESSPPQSFLLAIVEADALADTVLKELGFEGEHMADRLDKLNADFAALDKIWRAHRLRNEIVHTPGFTVSEGDARKTIGYYEAFLKEIGVI